MISTICKRIQRLEESFGTAAEEEYQEYSRRLAETIRERRRRWAAVTGEAPSAPQELTPRQQQVAEQLEKAARGVWQMSRKKRQ
jgi:hypothetical protein